MRKLQVRWLGHAAAIAVVVTSIATAQQQPPPTPETAPPANTGGGRGGQPTTPTPPPTQPQPRVQTPPRPLFVTGQVIMSDGTEIPERVMIERVCGTNSIRPEGYTDSRGYFSFQLGANQMAFADASTGFLGDAFGGGQPTSTAGLDPNATGALSGAPSESPFWNCELRAKLPGYRSDSVILAGKRFGDGPNVGNIILHSMKNVTGLTESAAAALAPKDSRKAYEKGLEAVRKNKPDQAEKDLRKAVELYPRHAPAWHELGKLLEQRSQRAEAREAYAKALTADANYLPPYVQLYRIDFQELNWQALADRTEQVLRMNPYEYPEAYYYNGVANLQLEKFAAAEKSTRQALELDKKKQNPKSHYVLGWALVRQQKLVEAAQEFRSFLEAVPNTPDKKGVDDLLAQIDRALAAQNQK
jgi:tetratricopeptide (TPR) repeat protein